MFLLVLVWRELRSRLLQSALTAIALGLGVGLVGTVSAASTGVAAAQAAALHSLYGIGTDLAVTGARPRPTAGGGGLEPGGSGKDDVLWTGEVGLLRESEVRAVEQLKGVTAVAGGLTLTDVSMGSPTTVSVDGVDVSRSRLGPLGSARVVSGRRFRPTDRDDNVALVDTDYARANGLRIGSSVSLAGRSFLVIGLVEQAHGSGAADVYIPLAAAQAVGQGPGAGSLQGRVDVIYVAATSAAAVPAVQREIGRLQPSATVTAASNVAAEVSGSLAGAATLINDVGRWIAVSALLASIAAAALLTAASVTRRTRELGTLKALGWSRRRLVVQIEFETLVLGIAGGALGVGLAYAGAAAVDRLAPAAARIDAHPEAAALGLVVWLALAGALLAGGLGAWRGARLRPVQALAQLE